MTESSNPPWRLAPALAAAALLAAAPLAGTGSAQAQPAAAHAAMAAAAQSETPQGRTGRKYPLTFRQLGAAFPLQLRGVQGAGGVQFGVRGDEVVTSARLHLNYAYSPALLPELSHLRVLVNEQVVATLPVPQAQAGQNLQRVIDIPPRLIGGSNRLNIELIGHYTMDCEDPAHSSLWAHVGNDSVLELSVNPLVLANDLALLPEPFFDRRDVRPLQLPIVFSGTPDAAQLEAAGTLSSWFGALAGARGASFPVALGRVPPKGHAIVLSVGGRMPPGVEAASPDGPAVTMAPHPGDPTAKLLVLSGRDALELKRAATALALGAPALSGATATIREFKQAPPRKPYDAPHWLPQDRPVTFGELAQASTLGVSGQTPDLIRVNFQVPPDLFGWRQRDIPVHLKYRYTARPEAGKSTLNINLNDQFLRSLPLRAASHEALGRLDRWLGAALPADDLLPAEDVFRVPLSKLPARGQLQFHYHHEVIRKDACKDVPLDNLRGTVEPDSTIDLSGFSHFLAMPDLAAFGHSGFPFSRLADLSESAVLLPAQPEPGDYGAYLSLMGHMGSVTGYPAHAVTVVLGDTLRGLEDKDLLVIASGGNPPLLARWAEHLPFRLDGDGKRFHLSDAAPQRFKGWGLDLAGRTGPGRHDLDFHSASTEAVLAGFESPLRPGRSVVLLASSQATGLQQITAALLDPEQRQRIQGSAAVVHGKEVRSLAAEQTYHVGRLGPVTYVQWWLSRHPLVLAALGVAMAGLTALMLYMALRARAHRRLDPTGQSPQ